ncbi:MAG: acetolactate synthase small subunit [Nitrospirae bacterium]|nr:acetolactate synthase small subunit [Nitrospirota bacterium]
MRHTISVLVENKFGVLSRVSGLFSGRGYNIESISVGETIDPQISVMTIVTIKVSPRKADRLELLKLTEIFRGRIVDSGPTTYTIEITGEEGKMNAFIELIKPFGIKEFVRTGKVAIAREGIKK